MGCSPSVVYPYPMDQQPIMCSNVVLNGHVFINGKEIEDASMDIHIPPMQEKLKDAENNDENFNSLNTSLTESPPIYSPNLVVSPTDSANEKKVMPFFSESKEPLSAFMWYGHGLKKNGLRPIRSFKTETVKPIKIVSNTDCENLRGVLKHPSSRKKVIQNRPLKSVTFLESVTVVTVR